MSIHEKLIVIVGPTASGKSALAIKLAKRFGGEIVSADSRQVYRRMDLGTGKVTKTERKQVPHHLLDVSSPKKEYTVTHFLSDAKKLISKINGRGNIPILCGGTGFWVDALVFGQQFPSVAPNARLRRHLEKKSTGALVRELQKKDPGRTSSIDVHNRRRLIRALEIIAFTKKPIPKIPVHSSYRVLWIGVTHPKVSLRKRIHTRLLLRLSKGLINEVKKLHVLGVSWKRLESFGLEYRFVSAFLQGRMQKKEMVRQLETAIFRYAKRQMTWFQRNKKIHWIQKTSQATKLAGNFVSHSR